MALVVPNQFPARPSTRRIALIGEAPGEQEAQTGLPFVGPSGQLLTKFLSQAGIDRDACFIGNVTGARPPGNDISAFRWDGEQIQSGLKQLTEDLRRFQPHFILCLGGTALRAFMGGKPGIDNWRGSLFRAVEIIPGVKCMATFHPARVMRDYGLTGVVKFDMAKASREARTDELVVHEDRIDIDFSKDELIASLRDFIENPHPVAVDIEGYPESISCIGFATSASYAFVVPFKHADGTSWWNELDETELWTWVQRVLEDPRIKKRCHNAAYELFCLAWGYGIVIEGLEHDTMVQWFELYCEMEKSLAFVVSVLTRHPYYKAERLVEDDTTQLRYNGKDCCRTFEVCERMIALLKPKQREHYEMNVSLLIPLAYMSLRGMRYDAPEAKRRLDATRQELYELQDTINYEAAKSPARPELKAFYEALGLRQEPDASTGCSSSEGKPPVVDGQSQAGSVDERRVGYRALGLEHRGMDREDVPDRRGDGAALESGLASEPVRRLDALLPLLEAAFCAKVRRVPEEAIETTWQPMRWNGKKWVKAGARVKALFDDMGEVHEGTEAPTNTTHSWLKPHHKSVTRNVQAPITSLEDVRKFTLDSKRDSCKRVCAILREVGKTEAHSCTSAQRGELATLLGIHAKLAATGRGKDIHHEDGTTEHGSEKDANWFAYEHLGMPKQFIKEKGRNTDRLTTNDSALIVIFVKTRNPLIGAFMKWRYHSTRTKTLKCKPDADGRIRCSYNLVGTETSRLSCSQSNTGSGYNLQTTTDDLRDLILADEGCEFGQFDERGADGYTIAAHCMRFGDDTMMRDLEAGIKPVNVIVLLYTEGAHINALPREELLVAQERVSKKSWQYAATKPILYGKCYLMGVRKMVEGIAEDSFKDTGEAVVVSVAQGEQIMARIDLRYPGITRWQHDSGKRMIAEGALHSSVGFVRRFFGRKSMWKRVQGRMVEEPDRQTLGEWLGHEPQFYTTLGTKLALKRLWTDPENRREDGSLRIEPLHTVHDSLNPQWRVEDREFARRKVLPEWFNNEMLIAGTKLVIPASGTCGPNWKDQEAL